jgi:hypothetical protein
VENESGMFDEEEFKYYESPLYSNKSIHELKTEGRVSAPTDDTTDLCNLSKGEQNGF